MKNLTTIQLEKDHIVALQKLARQKAGPEGTFSNEAVVEYLNEYKRGMSDGRLFPLLQPNAVGSGTYPSVIEYNRIFSQAKLDIDLLFQHTSSLTENSVENYNDLRGLLLEIEAKMAHVGSLLADYRMYTFQSGPGIYFLGDSFNDKSKLDSTSSSLDEELCSVDPLFGILTLPITKKEIARSKTVRINTDSNGVVGNNNQIGTPLNNQFITLVDGDPNTWFEYERVGDPIDSLILSLTIVLEQESVINNINLSTINFGTPAWTKVRVIDTSLNGTDFIPVDEDIPIVNWGRQTKESIFNTDDQGQQTGTRPFLFTPRLAKYVRLVLEQPYSYPIETVSGIKDRWAIGIKDINVQGIQYESQGQFVSHNFLLGEQAQKLAISSIQEPLDSPLGSLNYEVSFNSGSDWVPISAMELSSNTIEEILDPEKITEDLELEDTDAASVSVRGTLIRNTDAFGGDSASQVTAMKTEFFAFPSAVPFTVALKETPVDATSISVNNPLSGAVGERYKKFAYYVGKVSHPTGDTSYPEISIPFDNLTYKDIHVQVGEKEWTRLYDLSGSGIFDEVFLIDTEGQKIIFGNDLVGKLPLSSQPIFVWFGRARCHVTPGLKALLDLPWDAAGQKARTQIYREGATQSWGDTLKPGSHKVKLKYENLDYTTTGGLMDSPFTNIEPSGGVWTSTTPPQKHPLTTWVPFHNGYKEFVEYVNGLDSGVEQAILDGCYTVDPIQGILYLPYNETTPTDNPAFLYTNKSIVATYSYQQRNYVPDFAWNFAKGSLKQIEIDSDYFGSEQYTMDLATTLEDQATSFNLGGFSTVTGFLLQSLVPKTVSFLDPATNLADPDWVEIPYTDGAKEFELFTDAEKIKLFSVNYPDGIVYSAFTPLRDGTSYYNLSFQFTNYYVEYVLGQALKEGTDWKLGNTRELQFSEEFALETLQAINVASGEPRSDKALRVNYEYIVNSREALQQLEPYYSPVLYEYRLIAVSEKGLQL